MNYIKIFGRPGKRLLTNFIMKLDATPKSPLRRTRGPAHTENGPGVALPPSCPVPGHLEARHAFQQRMDSASVLLWQAHKERSKYLDIRHISSEILFCPTYMHF